MMRTYGPVELTIIVGTALCFLVVIVALGLLIYSLARGGRSATRTMPPAGPAPADSQAQTPQGWTSPQAQTPSQSWTSPSAQTPLEVLQMRYARGEITKEQFDQMRRDLGL